jgi:alpha-galactosidase
MDVHFFQAVVFMIPLHDLFQDILQGRVAPVSFDCGDGAVAPRLGSVTCLEPRVPDAERWELSYSVDGESPRLFLVVDYDPEGSVLTWRPRLFAEKSTPRVSNLCLMDLRLDHGSEHILRGVSGGFLSPGNEGESPFPPRGLKPWEKRIGVGESFALDCGGCGKSSDKQIPIWLFEEESGGVWFGPEWSGCWDLAVDRDAGGSRLRLRMTKMDFRMLQGEEILLPAFSLGVHAGDARAGWNHLRRTIRDRFMARDKKGRPILPPVAHQGLFGPEDYYTEEGLHEEMRRAAELGCEYFVFNAHWYFGPVQKGRFAKTRPMPWGSKPAECWPNLLGDYEFSEERFPSGPDALSDFVHSLGMKLGFWIDPRFGTDSRALSEDRGVAVLPDPNYGKGADFHSPALVDLTREAGRRWLEETLERIIRVYHADWVWLDMNAYPRNAYWDLHEEADRKGLMELGFYNGLYEVFDRVMRRHPSVIVETCANGGKVIDLGMIRRSHTIWVNDWVGFEGGYQVYDTDVNRNLRSGASHCLPGALVQNSMYIPWAVTQSAEPYDIAHFLSQFAGTLCFGQRVKFWKRSDIENARRCVVAYKEFRPLLLADYYELFPIPETKDAWDGWQFHDPQSGKGAVLLFRLAGNRRESVEAPAPGLDKESKRVWEIVIGEGEIEENAGTLKVRLDGCNALMARYRPA